MAMLTAYLRFRNQTREALDLYRSVLGGEVGITTFADVPELGADPAEQDLVMHGRLETPLGLVLMAADTGTMVPFVAPTSGVTVSLSGSGAEDLAYVSAAHAALSEGASDVLPFAKAPWGDHYGHLTDRFGISWMFDVGEV